MDYQSVRVIQISNLINSHTHTPIFNEEKEERYLRQTRDDGSDDWLNSTNGGRRR